MQGGWGAEEQRIACDNVEKPLSRSRESCSLGSLLLYVRDFGSAEITYDAGKSSKETQILYNLGSKALDASCLRIGRGPCECLALWLEIRPLKA